MNKRTLAVARAIATIGATGGLIIGATFAATSVGTVALTANSFAATTPGLSISNNGTAFADTATGFDFGNVSTSTQSTTMNFWLEDTSGGTTPLGVTVAAANPGAFTGLDQTKVMVNIEKDGGSTVDSFSLSDLQSSTPALSAENAPTIETGGTTPVPTEYNVWLTLTSGAITGTPVSTSNAFDLDFAGTSGS